MAALEGKLEKEREARVALEARVSELAKAEDVKSAQLVRTVAELDEAREKQARLEKRVEELATRVAGDGEPEWFRHNASTVALAQAAGRKPDKSFADAANRRKPAARAPAEAPIKDSERG
ncbi:hypothetical protein HPB48_006799 [Haemaphysalis longicornis]|uniref:Uncharacterized protein n=1 Tax=Haemaphysalis longicornis TaxID=44386 RepID=A0A9J6FE99_HAELO|nr:hypothetical protein HPB48_006799 [Haemaphysalis longicornis]